MVTSSIAGNALPVRRSGRASRQPILPDLPARANGSFEEGLFVLGESALQVDPWPDGAADLIQDIFTVLLEKLPGFRYDPQRSFRAWLKTILLNRWRNRCRRQTLSPTAADEGTLTGLAAPEAVPFFEEEEYRQALVG